MKYGKAYLGDVLISDPNPDKPVRFYDYDGTLVTAFTIEEVQAMTALPAAPDHTADGLVFDGWNWSLEDLKAEMIDADDFCDVGAFYKTSDGFTHCILDIGIPQTITLHLTASILSPNSVTTVDWGDGTTEEFIGYANAARTHTYEAAGVYRLRVYIDIPGSVNYKLAFGGDGPNYRAIESSLNISGNIGNSVRTLVKAVYLADNWSLSSYALQNFTAVEKVSLSASSQLGGYALSGCLALHFITCPLSLWGGTAYNLSQSGVRVIAIPRTIYEGSLDNFLSGCCALARLFVPNSNGSRQGFASGCTALRNVCIAKNAKVGYWGFFNNCNSLEAVKLNAVDNTLASYQFNSCYSLSKIDVKGAPTEIQSSCFSQCYSLPEIPIVDSVTILSSNFGYRCTSLRRIEVPANVQTLGSYFASDCPSLEEIEFKGSIAQLPAYSITSLPTLQLVKMVGIEEIKENCFRILSNLRSITLKGVVKIGNNVFYSCPNLAELHLQMNTPPTLGSNFLNGNTKVKIYVPAGTLAAYQSATNWSAFAQFMVEESE